MRPTKAKARTRWVQPLVDRDGLRTALYSFRPDDPPTIQVPIGWTAFVHVLHGIVRVESGARPVQPSPGVVAVDEAGPVRIVALVPDDVEPERAGATVLVALWRAPCGRTEAEDGSADGGA